jgi:hypothetical protein
MTVGACLLTLTGCATGDRTLAFINPSPNESAGASASTTSPSLHSGPQVAIGSCATVNTQAAAGRPAETQDATDLMIAKPRLGKADFGPNDPGVTVITADQGGNINLYEKRFFGAESGAMRWAVDGYCNSACTMVLGTGRVCATPRAQFGFHAGHSFLLRWKFMLPEATYQMYQRYPDDVKAWVNAHHAMDGFRMTMMRQPEVASYVPTCAASTRKKRIDGAIAKPLR